MEKLSQEYILSIVFRHALDKENLLIKKCDEYYSNVKDKDMKAFLKDGIKIAEEHVNILKDKMIKLNIQ